MRVCVFLACMGLTACDTGLAPPSEASTPPDLVAAADDLSTRTDMQGRDLASADLSPPARDLATAPARDLAPPVDFAPDLARVDASLAIAGTQLFFHTNPVGAAFSSGQTETYVVYVTDAHGVIDASATPPVTLSLDGTTTLGTTNAVAGVATFTAVALLPAGTHTLVATAPMLSTATSGQFAIRFSRARFLSQPMSTTDGVPWSPTVQFELIDELGNRDVTNPDHQLGFVTWELLVGTGAFSSVPAYAGPIAGVVTFPNAPIVLGTQEAIQIRVDTTYGQPHTITSDPFDITVGPPVRFGANVVRFPRNLPRRPFALLDRASYSATFSAPGLISLTQTISIVDFGDLPLVSATYLDFLAADAVGGSRIFMKGQGPIFAVSTDGGETIASSQALTFDVAAIAPSSPLVGYGVQIGHDGTLQLSSTADGGITWGAVSSVSDVLGNGIGIDVSPGNASELIVTCAGSLYRSTDGGATLTRVLGEVNANQWWAFARAPSSPATIYAALSTPSGLRALYGSSDGGATWSPLTTPASITSISSLCVDAASAQRVYVTPGHWRTDDGFATATAIGPQVGFDQSSADAPLTCHPTHGGVVYGYGEISEDAGATFATWSDDSLANANIEYMVPGAPSIMFTSYGVSAMGVP